MWHARCARALHALGLAVIPVAKLSRASPSPLRRRHRHISTLSPLNGRLRAIRKQNQPLPSGRPKHRKVRPTITVIVRRHGDVAERAKANAKVPMAARVHRPDPITRIPICEVAYSIRPVVADDRDHGAADGRLRVERDDPGQLVNGAGRGRYGGGIRSGHRMWQAGAISFDDLEAQASS